MTLFLFSTGILNIIISNDPFVLAFYIDVIPFYALFITNVFPVHCFFCDKLHRNKLKIFPYIILGATMSETKS